MNNIEHLLGNVSLSKFLEEYWQQKFLLIRDAIADYSCPISANEMAGLACEPEVESRIIIEQAENHWRCMHGPFDDSTFTQLPDTHWTLLLQSANLYIEEFAQLLEQFKFIPNWRVDDIMVSYAAPNGSVGPHIDNYDVFLLQAQGTRRWSVSTQVAQESDYTPNLDLKILKSFNAENTWELKAGDMLYLPPGVAHHGVAQEDVEDCITVSIGFRAPNYAELSSALLDEVITRQVDVNESKFYQDPNLPTQKNAGEISDWAVKKIDKIVQQEIDNIMKDGDWLGKFLTSNTVQLEEQEELVQTVTPEQCLQLLTEGQQFVRNESCNMAFINKDNSEIRFYCNGQATCYSLELLPIISLVCNNRYPSSDLLVDTLDTKEAKKFLCELLNQGYFYYE